MRGDLFQGCRCRRLGVLLGLVLVASSVVVAQDDPSVADPDHDHGASSLPKLTDQDFSDPEMNRIRRLETHIMCACPRENFTRTLSNCPDGCADPQKGWIRRAVRGGLTDEQIFSDMEGQHGPKVLAAPRDLFTYLLPFGILLAAAVVTLVVVASWSRRGQKLKGHRATVSSLVRPEELEEIDRELDKLE